MKHFGKFVIKRSSNGKFFFVLNAANGEVIAMSELYETKQSAYKGIAAVKKSLLAGIEEDIENTSEFIKIRYKKSK